MIDVPSSLPAEWIEGVTPTWTLCPHGIRIIEGTYLRDQVPTGEHPDCLTRHEVEMERDALAYERERLDEYYAAIGPLTPITHGYGDAE